MVERSKNPAATHVPILIALSKLFTVKRVIEFGAGLHSTPLFLDRSVFPTLRALHSYENNGRWISEIKRRCVDRRLRLVEVDGPMHSVVRKVDFSSFDICLIDDSVTIAERVKTIKTVALRFDAMGIVVIHDYERAINRKAAEGFKHCFRFSALNPNSGLCWNKCANGLDLLFRFDTLLKRSPLDIQPDDVKGWMSVIEDLYLGRVSARSLSSHAT